MTDPTPPDPMAAFASLVADLEFFLEHIGAGLLDIGAGISHPFPPSRRLTRMHTAYHRRYLRNHRRRR